jgi:hypothetical protein
MMRNWQDVEPAKECLGFALIYHGPIHLHQGTLMYVLAGTVIINFDQHLDHYGDKR